VRPKSPEKPASDKSPKKNELGSPKENEDRNDAEEAAPPRKLGDPPLREGP
jgi:hypothetical protein